MPTTDAVEPPNDSKSFEAYVNSDAMKAVWDEADEHPRMSMEELIASDMADPMTLKAQRLIKRLDMDDTWQIPTEDEEILARAVINLVHIGSMSKFTRRMDYHQKRDTDTLLFMACVLAAKITKRKVNDAEDE